MKHCLVAVSALLADVPFAVAQSKVPRGPDGKPDLSGFWKGPLLRNMDKNVPGGFAAIFTPAGQAAYEYNRTQTVNPEGTVARAALRALTEIEVRFSSNSGAASSS